MIRKIFLSFIVVVLACCAVAGYGFWYLNSKPIEIANSENEIVLHVKNGATVNSIIKQMIEQGLQARPEALRLAFKFFGNDRTVHAGRYLLKPNMTVREIVDHISKAEVMMSKLTLVEGITTKDFLKQVFANKDLDHDQTPPDVKDVMKKVGAPENTHPEGQFATDTYTFAAGIPDMVLLGKAYRQQQERIKRAWETKSPDVVVKNPYELLILASLIEKETGNPEDRFLVSSVFNNRLKKNMLLQTDPTVIYGIEDFDGRILKSHLKKDHPYNTYIHAGLPPTPICNPGIQAIEAAAHPAKSDYLYFVAQGNGKSYFSKTLSEHNAAVRKYLRSQGK